MITALLAATTATAFSAFSSGVCISLAGYTLAKNVGKANFTFKN